MRFVCLLMFGAMSAFSQITAGVKAGVPRTDFFKTVDTVSTSVPNRYIVGVTAELRLPFGLGVEADALYRHLNYSDGFPVNTTTFRNTRTTANSWEFPILLKYRFPMKIVRPFVDGGIAFDTLSSVQQSITDTITPTRTSTTRTTSDPESLRHNSTKGLVLGAGLDIHALVIHVSPEIRYTRWTSERFNLSGIIHSNQNQAEFLLGITF